MKALALLVFASLLCFSPASAQSLRRTVAIMRVDQGQVENLQGGLVSGSDIQLFTRDLAVLCFYLYEYDLTTEEWVPYVIPADAALSFGIKENLDRAGVFLAYSANDQFNAAGDWSLSDRATGKLSIRVNANTTAITNLFTTSTVFRDLIGEVQMIPAGSELPTTLAQFPVRVLHDIIQGDEGLPTPAIPPYVTLDMLQEITDEQIAEKLDAVEIVGGPLYPHFLIIDSEPVYRNVTGTTSTNTVVDALLESWTVTSAIKEHQMTVPYMRNTSSASIVWSSSNPSVATVDSEGRTTLVSGGEAIISAELVDFEASKTLTFSEGFVVNYTNVIGGATGWVRKELTDSINDALIADAAANDDELFDVRDWATHTYTRNASCWAYSSTGGSNPWTGIAVWATGKTGTGAQSIRGTAISADTIAFAWHNAPGVGTQFKWVGTDGLTYTRTMTGRARLGSGDAGVGKLDSPLPAEVVPLKILPSNYAVYFSVFGTYGYQFPAINVNRNLQASVHDIGQLSTGIGGFGVSASPSRIPLRFGYYQQPVVGDSGSPVVAVVDNQLVLLMTWYTPFFGAGFLPGDTLTAALTAIGGTAPAEIDLSAYNDTLPSM